MFQRIFDLLFLNFSKIGKLVKTSVCLDKFLSFYHLIVAKVAKIVQISVCLKKCLNFDYLIVPKLVNLFKYLYV